MPHILKGDDFLRDFLLRKLLSRDVFVFNMIRTVETPVYAVIGQIQGSKKHYAVAVKILLDLFGKVIYLIYPRLITAGKQHACIPVIKALALFCLL